MIQAVNELILGIDLRSEHSQVTYYHQSFKEPMTAGSPQGEEEPFFPMALRMDEKGDWHFWDGLPDEKNKNDKCRISGIYELAESGNDADAGDEKMSAAKILGIYFSCCIETLRFVTKQTRFHIMVTVRKLTEQWSGVITEALEGIGIERKYIYIQDYLSAFYYYTVNHHKKYES